MTKLAFLLMLVVALTAFANPRPQMNLALRSLIDLLPFMAREEKFLDKKNETEIKTILTTLETTFSNLKHDQMIKNDLFAPSYAMIRQSISESVMAFNDGNKGFAHWRLSEITNQCLDCHTRLPESYSSNFQEKKISLEPKRFQSTFDLGTAQFIVRDYEAAEKSFKTVIEDNINTKKFMDTIEAFRNVLIINTKIKPNVEKMLAFIKKHSHNKLLPMDIQEELGEWEMRLKEIQKIKLLQSPLQDDKSVRTLISTFLEPVKGKSDVFIENYDVYFFVSIGLLSRYLFTHPKSEMGAEISYWTGWSENLLKRAYMNSSGDLFFKQCILRYPKVPTAMKCLKELKESIESQFPGPGGLNTPAVKKELADLEALITK